MSQDPPSVSSAAQLEAVLRALELFKLSLAYTWNNTRRQEEDILPRFEAVADALASIRPSLNAANGSGPDWWENEAVPVFREIDTLFQEVARAWGWEPYLTPSLRETTKEQLRECFRLAIELPLDEAAIVLARSPDATLHRSIRDRARRGREAGYNPEITIDEAKTRLHPDSDWSLREVETACYGRVYPELTQEQKRRFERLLINLPYALKPVMEESKADSGAPVASENLSPPPAAAASSPTGIIENSQRRAPKDPSDNPEQAKRTPPRGTLDETATIDFIRNPSLTYAQLAKMLGCSPQTLRNRRKCPLLVAAKARTKASRGEFRGKGQWINERDRDE
jgi:hypothetical protein